MKQGNRHNFATLSLLAMIFNALLAPGILRSQEIDPELKRRQDEATTKKMEAEAQKAQADIAKVRSDIATQQAAMRKQQLELVKSNTTVEGTFVENNIAASKAIGCSAIAISKYLSMPGVDPYNTLAIYSPESANALSEYASVRAQVGFMSKGYDDKLKRLEDANSKQDAELRASIEAEAQKEREDLIKKADALKVAIDTENDLKKALLTKPTVAKKLGLTKRTLLMKSAGKKISLALPNQFPQENKFPKSEPTAFAAGNSAAGGILSMLSPVGAAVSLGLDIMALFKTDVSIKGSDVKPGVNDLTGYIFQTLNIQLNNNTPSVIRKKKIISFENIVLTSLDLSNSGLFQEMQALNTKYIRAKKDTDETTRLRKAVIAFAKLKLGFEGLETELKKKEAITEEKFKAMIKDDGELQRREYDRSLIQQKLANSALQTASREAEKAGLKFDETFARLLLDVEVLNGSADMFSKKFSGDTAKDKEAGAQRSLTDYLRAEVLFDKLNDKSTPLSRSLWLDLSVSANGGNQRRQSSPIIDVFTRGPRISYNGGAVVTYQLREIDGSVVLAGTVWTYTPYRQAKNILTFDCNGVDSRNEFVSPIQSYRNR